MSDIDFVNKYLKDFSSLLEPNKDLVDKIISTRDILVNTNKKKQNNDFWQWG